MIDLNTGHFGSSMPCGCPQSIGQLYLVCVHGSIHNLLRFSRYTRYRHITTWPVTVTAKARPEVGPHARPNDGSATGWCDYWFTTSILRPRIVRARKTCPPSLLRAGDPRLLPATLSCPARPEPMQRPQQLGIPRSRSDSECEVPRIGTQSLRLRRWSCHRPCRRCFRLSGCASHA